MTKEEKVGHYVQVERMYSEEEVRDLIRKYHKTLKRNNND